MTIIGTNTRDGNRVALRCISTTDAHDADMYAASASRAVADALSAVTGEKWESVKSTVKRYNNVRACIDGQVWYLSTGGAGTWVAK